MIGQKHRSGANDNATVCVSETTETEEMIPNYVSILSRIRLALSLLPLRDVTLLLRMLSGVPGLPIILIRSASIKLRVSERMACWDQRKET